jgi:hypothetical protein
MLMEAWAWSESLRRNKETEMADNENTSGDRHLGHRTFAFVSGMVGLLAFLVFGLVPSLVYGGYAGVTLAAALLGHPLGTSLLARGIVAFGMLAGLLATAGLFVVCTAATTTVIYRLFDEVRILRAARREHDRTVEAQC